MLWKEGEEEEGKKGPFLMNECSWSYILVNAVPLLLKKICNFQEVSLGSGGVNALQDLHRPFVLLPHTHTG